ncbi:MAG: carboxylating nicotinate-nucleotide diphosphorylase [Thermodesulfobacteriota bacterium]
MAKKKQKEKEGMEDRLTRFVDEVVHAALSEDIGPGDITTEALISKTKRGSAEIVAKEPMVIAGQFVARRAFELLDKRIKYTVLIPDGVEVKEGTVIATVKGPLRAVLTAERVALNFLQRLSGVATLTASFVEKLAGTGVGILDTRKTTPCLRLLEKYAVKAGGGVSHRFGLFDAVLIKDNHIESSGGIAKAVIKVRRKYPTGVIVEVECRTLKEVKEAITAEADIIMLDNMDMEKTKKAVKLIKGRALTEASGGVTLKSVKGTARCGVDFISVGALTHSARALDINLRIST